MRTRANARVSLDTYTPGLAPESALAPSPTLAPSLSLAPSATGLAPSTSLAPNSTKNTIAIVATVARTKARGTIDP